jgi:hypothetical protein
MSGMMWRFMMGPTFLESDKCLKTVRDIACKSSMASLLRMPFELVELPMSLGASGTLEWLSAKAEIIIAMRTKQSREQSFVAMSTIDVIPIVFLETLLRTRMLRLTGLGLGRFQVAAISELYQRRVWRAKPCQLDCRSNLVMMNHPHWS